MQWIKTCLHEIYGLFVDDGSFAVSILVWLFVIAMADRLKFLPSPWIAPLLFAGLAGILIESALRYARRH